MRAPRTATSRVIGGRGSCIARTYRLEDRLPQATLSPRGRRYDDISCHDHDLTTRNEFHNGKAQKKDKRWIDHDLLSGLRCKTIRAMLRRLSQAFHSNDSRDREPSTSARARKDGGILGPG